MTTPIRLLLADDHPVVRAGLRAVLDTEPDFHVAAEAATAERAVALAATGEFDVVLMDLQFGPGLHGSEATAAITSVADAPRVLILTTYDTDADILAAVEAGAAGYLLKDAPPEELAAAVRTAAAGRSALAPAVAHRLMDRMRTPAEALTKRELEVLQLVGEGLSNLRISKELFLSQATVKSHLVHIYAKLGVDSRTAAVAAAPVGSGSPARRLPEEVHGDPYVPECRRQRAHRADRPRDQQQRAAEPGNLGRAADRHRVQRRQLVLGDRAVRELRGMSGQLPPEPGDCRTQLHHPRVLVAAGHPRLPHAFQQSTPPRTSLCRCFDRVPDRGQVSGGAGKLTP